MMESQPKCKVDTDCVTSLTEITKVTFGSPLECRHISYAKQSKAWISDMYGNLVLMDLTGTMLDKKNVTRGVGGYHSLTDNDDLLIAVSETNCIVKVKSDEVDHIVIRTGEWKPISIYCCHSNGCILVGLVNDEKDAKIIRYDRSGCEQQEITSDDESVVLYHVPLYVTENQLNGDICTSDMTDWVNLKGRLVVVDKSGRFRYSYEGQAGSSLYPSGLCTDSFGHLLLFDVNSASIHMLDKNGNFLTILIKMPDDSLILSPQGLCLDDSNRLWCGNEKELLVYNYQQLSGKNTGVTPI